MSEEPVQSVPASEAAPSPELAPTPIEQPPPLPMGPITAAERIEVIDILRGLALFGIIAANMRGFFGPEPAYMDWLSLWTGKADRVAQGFIEVFIQGKFVTLFSFLFGLGFAVQMTRAEERGRSISFYPRRLLILVGIGAIHSFLIWWGDILIPYALMGFVLLLFRKRQQKTIMIWTIVVGALPIVMCIGYFVASRFTHIPVPPSAKPEELKQAIAVYSHGTWLAIMAQRYRDWVSMNGGWFFTPVFLLPRFLFGLWLWRSGFIANIASHTAALRKVCLWGFAIGMPLSIASEAAVQFLRANPMQPGLAGQLVNVAGTISLPALSACYASLVALLAVSARWRALVQPFAAVGRTALTTYLMQSIICTLLFYSYGLGWFGRVGPAIGLIPTFVVYAAQVWFANWWLARYQFGPVEWVWRSLTYGKRQPMRRLMTAPAAA